MSEATQEALLMAEMADRSEALCMFARSHLSNLERSVGRVLDRSTIEQMLIDYHEHLCFKFGLPTFKPAPADPDSVTSFYEEWSHGGD